MELSCLLSMAHGRAGEKWVPAVQERTQPHSSDPRPPCYCQGMEQGQPQDTGSCSKGRQCLPCLKFLWKWQFNHSTHRCLLAHSCTQMSPRQTSPHSILPLPTEGKAQGAQGGKLHTAAVSCLMILTWPKSVCPLIH